MFYPFFGNQQIYNVDKKKKFDYVYLHFVGTVCFCQDLDPVVPGLSGNEFVEDTNFFCVEKKNGIHSSITGMELVKISTVQYKFLVSTHPVVEILKGILKMIC